jgi:hypothetical protein
MDAPYALLSANEKLLQCFIIGKSVVAGLFS